MLKKEIKLYIKRKKQAVYRYFREYNLKKLFNTVFND